uniref:Globin family profile domain-containing protein n=1 Tax=Ditylenchus dipsaci TaxID=166011 RepID=A0A915DZB6_9BILA
MGSGASKTGGSPPQSNGKPATAAPNGAAPNGADAEANVVVDKRLPFSQFRELFTMKNYWKTVRRNDKQCSKTMFFKYLKANPENKMRYSNSSLYKLNLPTGFETIAASYLKVFDDVINIVEESPSDASSACQRLSAVGKMHRTKVANMKFDDFQQLEAPFLYMIQEVLQDRYNDKAENLFRKFFQFCLKYILEGFNS